MSMMSKIQVLFLCSFLFACSSTRNSDVSAQDDSASSNDPNSVICKKEHVVGSQFRKVVCRTVAEIGRQRELAQRAGSGPSFSSSTSD